MYIYSVTCNPIMYNYCSKSIASFYSTYIVVCAVNCKMLYSKVD